MNNKIILIDNQYIKVEIEEGYIKRLDKLDEYDIKEIFSYAENAEDVESIEGMTDEWIGEYADSSISIYDNDIWNEIRALSFREINELESNSWNSMSEYDDLNQYFRALLFYKNYELIADDLAFIMNNIEVANKAEEPREFEDLEPDVKENVKEDLYENFVYNWCDAEYWCEYYNEWLSEKHYIFNNFKIDEFDLSGCQGDFVNLAGYISGEDLKRLAYEYGVKIFDAYNNDYFNDPEDRRDTIKAILRLNDSDEIKIESRYGLWNEIDVTLYSDVFYRYDDKLRGRHIENLVKYIIYDIEYDLRRDAKYDIDEYIESQFEGYFEDYINEYLFTPDGEPVDRY